MTYRVVDPVLLKVGLIVTTAIVAVMAVLSLFVDPPRSVPLKDALIQSMPLYVWVAINVVVHELFDRSTGPLWDFGGIVVALIAMLIIWWVRRPRAG